MRKLLIVTIAAMILAVGCSKNDGAGTSPSPSATGTAGATSSPGAASPNASPNGGAGTATGAPTGGAATTAPDTLPSITNEQMEKLDLNTTSDDLLKIIGKDVKPIKESAGKKTYEVKVAGLTNTFADFTYSSDGKLSEKNVFTR
jgi:DMSO/TMAO reductase YedYZ molybdopterin-dependent catalytic subunit